MWPAALLRLRLSSDPEECQSQPPLAESHSALPFCGSVNYHTTCTEPEFDTHSLSLAFLWISQLSHYVYWTWIWHSVTQPCRSVDQSIITLCVLNPNLTLTHSALPFCGSIITQLVLNWNLTLTHLILPFCGSINYHTMCTETEFDTHSLSLAFLWLSQLSHYV